jgi:hypothetical protein
MACCRDQNSLLFCVVTVFVLSAFIQDDLSQWAASLGPEASPSHSHSRSPPLSPSLGSEATPLRVLMAGWQHPKNLVALALYTSVQLTHIPVFADFAKKPPAFVLGFDLVYLPSDPVNVSSYPAAARFLFGPHLGVFPDARWALIGAPFTYLQYCEWAKASLWLGPVAHRLAMSVEVVPFGVDTERFKPNPEVAIRSKVAIASALKQARTSVHTRRRTCTRI